MENWVIVSLTSPQPLWGWSTCREEERGEEKSHFRWDCHKLASPFRACHLSTAGSPSLRVLSWKIYRFPIRYPSLAVLLSPSQGISILRGYWHSSFSSGAFTSNFPLLRSLLQETLRPRSWMPPRETSFLTVCFPNATQLSPQQTSQPCHNGCLLAQLPNQVVRFLASRREPKLGPSLYGSHKELFGRWGNSSIPFLRKERWRAHSTASSMKFLLLESSLFPTILAPFYSLSGEEVQESQNRLSDISSEIVHVEIWHFKLGLQIHCFGV